MMAMFPIFMLGMVMSFIANASASAIRIEELLAEKPHIQEDPDAVLKDRLLGKIEFRNVCFRFGEGENAIDGVNLVVEPGQKIGILGTTGSGKSSLANLIPRLYDPQEGEVLVDDVSVKKMAFASLRTRVAMVLQETILFSGTIEENVRFGKPDADEKELAKAAEIACAAEFIAEKDDRWQETVGERGMGLSGGQRQRLAIARAVISDPDILILDDVTSSVDLETERRIVANIYREFPHKTILIISQKINTIQNADKIIIMDNGRIIGSGTHEELLAGHDTYREIFDTQSAQIL
jgi:ABC-type multidrug transport system fused ATPase/permease subunit